MPSAPQFSPRLRDIAATSFATLEGYWNCPDTRRRMDAETQHARDVMNAAMDRRMIANDTRFPVNWTPQEKMAAIAKIEGKAT
jgi:hypothetical protein